MRNYHLPLFAVITLALVPIGASAVCETFPRTLKQGSSGRDVLLLQRTLNTSKETEIARSGPGSPGNEVPTFGPATTRALKKFQAIHASEVLSPAGLTNPSGIAGVLTRKSLAPLTCNLPETKKPTSKAVSEVVTTKNTTPVSVAAKAAQLRAAKEANDQALQKLNALISSSDNRAYTTTKSSSGDASFDVSQTISNLNTVAADTLKNAISLGANTNSNSVSGNCTAAATAEIKVAPEIPNSLAPHIEHALPRTAWTGDAIVLTGKFLSTLGKHTIKTNYGSYTSVGQLGGFPLGMPNSKEYVFTFDPKLSDEAVAGMNIAEPKEGELLSITLTNRDGASNEVFVCLKKRTGDSIATGVKERTRVDTQSTTQSEPITFRGSFAHTPNAWRHSSTDVLVSEKDYRYQTTELPDNYLSIRGVYRPFILRGTITNLTGYKVGSTDDDVAFDIDTAHNPSIDRRIIRGIVDNVVRTPLLNAVEFYITDEKTGYRYRTSMRPSAPNVYELIRNGNRLVLSARAEWIEVKSIYTDPNN